MCDCFSQPCHICGTMLPVHLEGYNTGRSEILVFCNECAMGDMFGQRINDDRCLVWKTKEHGQILFAYLTKNAWFHKEGNCPNTGDSEIDNMKAFQKKTQTKMDKEWKESLHRFRKMMRGAATHRSKRGPKLYAVSDEEGRFKDIQTYVKEHKKSMKTRKGGKNGQGKTGKTV